MTKRPVDREAQLIFIGRRDAGDSWTRRPERPTGTFQPSGRHVHIYSPIDNKTKDAIHGPVVPMGLLFANMNNHVLRAQLVNSGVVTDC